MFYKLMLFPGASKEYWRSRCLLYLFTFPVPVSPGRCVYIYMLHSVSITWTRMLRQQVNKKKIVKKIVKEKVLKKSVKKSAKKSAKKFAKKIRQKIRRKMCQKIRQKMRQKIRLKNTKKSAKKSAKKPAKKSTRKSAKKFGENSFKKVTKKQSFYQEKDCFFVRSAVSHLLQVYLESLTLSLFLFLCYEQVIWLRKYRLFNVFKKSKQVSTIVSKATSDYKKKGKAKIRSKLTWRIIWRYIRRN